VLVRRDKPAAAEANVAQGDCHENVISGLNICEPGIYNLWLSGMEIRTLSGADAVRLNGLLLPWIVELTQDDLDRGTRTVVAPPGGVFRMTAGDDRHIAIPHYKVLAWTDETTLEIQMDANGTQLTYDNPTRCCFVIDPGFGIVIEHLATAAP